MKSSQEYIKLMNKLQDLFKLRDDSYTLCVVIGEIECALLRFIHKVNRPMTMKEIAQMYSISSSKVTRILNKLEKTGFVERYHSTNDRRNWYARITLEGKRMAENTKYKLDQFQKRVLEKLPEEDIDVIYARIKQFIDAYETVIKESEEQQ